MKSTDRQAFLAHYRRCVKCQQIHQVRTGQAVDHDTVVLLRLHVEVLGLLYDPQVVEEVLQQG